MFSPVKHSEALATLSTFQLFELPIASTFCAQLQQMSAAACAARQYPQRMKHSFCMPDVSCCLAHTHLVDERVQLKLACTVTHQLALQKPDAQEMATFKLNNAGACRFSSRDLK